ncbi:hypothetical protein KP509_05G065400 [Ceratopteris richardii]|uniref:Uncharacterized protein n=1 Tax=Ceratopteris richardii TaxID=49495 RepID=A0A8T2UMD6_CERRI|nr:hypothetical protein KP509_05G065400 [Ceratopteris richardii]
MFVTAIRLSSNRYPYIKGALFNSPGQADEAQRLSNVLLAILRRYGPLSVDHCWSHSKDEGFRSKRHMKLVLKWMKEKQQVNVVCKHLSDLSGKHGDMEFFYSVVDDKRKNTGKLRSDGHDM